MYQQAFVSNYPGRGDNSYYMLFLSAGRSWLRQKSKHPSLAPTISRLCFIVQYVANPMLVGSVGIIVPR